MEAFAIATFVASVAMIAAYLVFRRITSPKETGAFELPRGAAPLDVPTVMIVLISLAIMGASLWIILSERYDADTEKWAFASTASIVSFWLGTAVPKRG